MRGSSHLRKPPLKLTIFCVSDRFFLSDFAEHAQVAAPIGYTVRVIAQILRLTLAKLC